MADIPGNGSTTTILNIGSSITDLLEVGGDRDWIRIDLSAGQSYTFAVEGTGGTPVGDTQITLIDAQGAIIHFDDDSGAGLSSLLNFRAETSGTYYLQVSGYSSLDAGTYTVTASTYNGLPIYDNNQIASYLTDGFWNNFGGSRHAFATSTITYNVQNLTAEGQALAVAAFAAWSAVSGLNFVATDGSAQIALDDNQAGAFANYTAVGGSTSSANVNVSLDWLATYGTSLNSYSFQTYLHEIGHALGLGHAGNYNSTGGWQPDGTGDNHFLNDSWQATVMSYFSQDENLSVFASYAEIIAPMMADIVAIQDLYGLNPATNTAATMYGFGNTATGYHDFASFSQGSMVAFTIYDGGGVDTINASGFSVSQQIDLRAGSFSHIGGETSNIGIAVNTIIENAIGGTGADLIVGNQVANIINGSTGADIMRGLGGDDQYYVENYNDQVLESSALDGIDLVHSSAYFSLGLHVESIALFGTANVGANGNYLANSMYGNTGSNYLMGGGANDRLQGNAGNDALDGGMGFDTLIGGLGRDLFVFNAALGSGNVDTISDFVVADDTIRLENKFFTALTIEGMLAGAAFASNTSGLAQDPFDRIIYESDTGNLFYDSNGSAAGGSVLFARLQAGLALSAADFFVI